MGTLLNGRFILSCVHGFHNLHLKEKGWYCVRFIMPKEVAVLDCFYHERAHSDSLSGAFCSVHNKRSRRKTRCDVSVHLPAFYISYARQAISLCACIGLYTSGSSKDLAVLVELLHCPESPSVVPRIEHFEQCGSRQICISQDDAPPEVVYFPCYFDFPYSSLLEMVVFTCPSVPPEFGARFFACGCFSAKRTSVDGALCVDRLRNLLLQIQQEGEAIGLQSNAYSSMLLRALSEIPEATESDSGTLESVSDCFQLLHSVLDAFSYEIMYRLETVFRLLIRKYRRKSLENFGRSVSTSHFSTARLSLTSHRSRTATSVGQMFNVDLPVIDDRTFLTGGHFPNWEVEISKLPGAVEPHSADHQTRHLIVFVHGFMSCASDMSVLADAVLRRYSDVLQDLSIFLPKSNEDRDHSSIAEMGQNLAQELHDFMRLRGEFDRISFVGHSLGALVVRASLASPLLENILFKLGVFVSLGSPHLGTNHLDNMIVGFGLRRIMRKQPSACLQELCLTDRTGGTKLLESLSTGCQFGYFSHYVLFSSRTDKYIPLYSSRIELDDNTLRDSKFASSYVQMGLNLLKVMDQGCPTLDPKHGGQQRKFMRIMVDFQSVSKSEKDKNPLLGGRIFSKMNRLLGRSSHVAYLCNFAFSMQLAALLGQLLGLEPSAEENWMEARTLQEETNALDSIQIVTE
eukprot:ANDGO_02389.mRNA.1 hypothetical protein